MIAAPTALAITMRPCAESVNPLTDRSCNPALISPVTMTIGAATSAIRLNVSTRSRVESQLSTRTPSAPAHAAADRMCSASEVTATHLGDAVHAWPPRLGSTIVARMAIAVSHGEQMINRFRGELFFGGLEDGSVEELRQRKGVDPQTAARLAFRMLLVPGAVALIAGCIGFAQADRALVALRRHSPDVGINCVLTRGTFPTVSRLFAYARRRAANEIDRLTSALSAANERAERLAEFAKTLNNNYREGDAMMLVREIDTTDRGHVLQCDCIPNFKDIPNQRVREFLTTFGDVLKFAGYIQTVDKRRLPALADTPEPPATGATA